MAHRSRAIRCRFQNLQTEETFEIRLAYINQSILCSSSVSEYSKRANSAGRAVGTLMSSVLFCLACHLLACVILVIQTVRVHTVSFIRWSGVVPFVQLDT
jgi:hypothetical protein